jgi:hypothetical protein
VTDSTDERWLPVPGYEGLYEVSDQGRVRSLDRRVATARGDRITRGQVLKPSPSRGYQIVPLSKKGVARRTSVHLIVLAAFVGPRPSGLECCHGNGVRSDNRLENLRWDTRSENQRDAVRHGTNSRVVRTECPRGHAYDAANTRIYVKANGRATRKCRACRRIRYHGEWKVA